MTERHRVLAEKETEKEDRVSSQRNVVVLQYSETVQEYNQQTAGND